MTVALLLIFPALLILAGLFDLTTMTIPNWISGLVAVCFFVVALALGMPLMEVLVSVSIAFAILLISMGMFAMNWMGGGDAKLITAAALWMGMTNIAAFILCVCLIGGVATLAIMAFRQVPLPGQLEKVSWVARLHSAKEGVPYGIAISVAGVVLFNDTALFQLLTG
jgi:prepilin peptidase CpaA